MQNNLRNSKMVITALLVTVLLAEHRWQEKPSSSSSLLDNLNKRTIGLKWISGDLYFSFLLKAKDQTKLPGVLSSWILKTLKDRNCKASGQTFLLLGHPHGEKVFLIFWVKLMFQLLFINSSSYHVLLKEPVSCSCLPPLRYGQAVLKLSLSRLNKPILSSSPHRLGPPLKTILPSTALSPVSFYSRGPQNWAEYPDGISWKLNREIAPPFYVLALSSWLLPGVSLVISRAGAHCLLVIALCPPGLTGLFLQRCS